MPKDEPEKEPELVRLVAYIFEDEDAALEKEANGNGPQERDRAAGAEAAVS